MGVATINPRRKPTRNPKTVPARRLRNTVPGMEKVCRLQQGTRKEAQSRGGEKETTTDECIYLFRGGGRGRRTGGT